MHLDLLPPLPLVLLLDQQVELSMLLPPLMTKLGQFMELGKVMTLELERMTLGLNLLGLDQLIRADKLLKPPMLLAFQLDQLKLMKLLGQLQLDHKNMPLPPKTLASAGEETPGYGIESGTGSLFVCYWVLIPIKCNFGWNRKNWFWIFICFRLCLWSQCSLRPGWGTKAVFTRSIGSTATDDSRNGIG